MRSAINSWVLIALRRNFIDGIEGMTQICGKSARLF